MYTADIVKPRVLVVFVKTRAAVHAWFNFFMLLMVCSK